MTVRVLYYNVDIHMTCLSKGQIFTLHSFIVFKMFLNELRKEALHRTLQFLFNPNPSFTPPSFNNPAISSWVGETWHCGGGGRGWRSCKPL